MAGEAVTQVRLDSANSSMVGFVKQDVAFVGMKVEIGSQEWTVTNVYATWPMWDKEYPDRALYAAWWFRAKKVL